MSPRVTPRDSSRRLKYFSPRTSFELPMSAPQPFALQLESRRMEEWLYNSFDINPKIFTCQWGLGRHLLNKSLSSFFYLRATQTFTSSCYDRFNICLSDSHPGSQSIERCMIDKLNIKTCGQKSNLCGTDYC